PADSRLYEDSDQALGSIMHRYFIKVITYGDPNGEDLPRWEAVTDPGIIYELGTDTGNTTERYTDLYRILDRMPGAGNEQ
ncbi:MAG: hypothetical protein IJH98_10790, partial [Solobacterium sp.]|nr:hypothetical protein [Solobacterium sp.]